MQNKGIQESLSWTQFFKFQSISLPITEVELIGLPNCYLIFFYFETVDKFSKKYICMIFDFKQIWVFGKNGIYVIEHIHVNNF